MKFLHILGVAAAVLMTTAVAQQAATVQPAPEPEAAPVVALADNKPATAGDAAAGQAKAGVCAACHGLDGNATDPQYPKQAGQSENYVWRQLSLFKTGGRDNPIMLGMAAGLSEQDMRDIGAHYATLAVLPGVADDTLIATGPNAGKKFYQVGESIYRAGKPSANVPACMACHGPTGRGNPGPPYPSIGGQHAAYTVTQLQFFRSGGVWGKDADANPIMSQVAHNLSDEEIQGLATYIEGLHQASPAVAEAH